MNKKQAIIIMHLIWIFFTVLFTMASLYDYIVKGFDLLIPVITFAIGSYVFFWLFTVLMFLVDETLNHFENE